MQDTVGLTSQSFEAKTVLQALTKLCEGQKQFVLLSFSSFSILVYLTPLSPPLFLSCEFACHVLGIGGNVYSLSVFQWSKCC